MMNNEKGLQTLTETGLIEGTDTEQRVNNFLRKERVTSTDARNDLLEEDYEYLGSQITRKLNTLKGDELHEFIDKVEAILTDDSKRSIWEKNHCNISVSISRLMRQYHRMPTQTEIADDTGLSRQTVHKHLQEYQQSAHYTAQLEQFRLMGANVMTAVYEEAFKGDIKAAKLYLQAIGWLSNTGPRTTIGNQTNYIQVNGTVINEETLKQLPPDQLNILSNMIKGVTLLPDRADTQS